MAKNGFEFDKIPSLLSSFSDVSGWTLCIGAGTSAPVFPDWYTLSEELAMTVSPSKHFDIRSIREEGFAADSLIQMTKNMSSVSDEEFAYQMSEILYKTFSSKVAANEWKDITRVLESDFAGQNPRSEWETFIKYRDSVLSKTTANKLAPIILEAVEKNKAPKSIISFNAESLLFTILNSYLFDKTDADHPNPKKVFCKVINSFSSQPAKQIPYIFIHGLLPVARKHRLFSASIDKLVFSEQEYLMMSNNSFSWQSNVFLNACITQHMVFIGTSLTDPNMRQWLGWSHSNRIREMHYKKIDVTESTQHYWIRKKPANKSNMPWIEALVSHLGVRIVWLDNWEQTADALRKMLDL